MNPSQRIGRLRHLLAESSITEAHKCAMAVTDAEVTVAWSEGLDRQQILTIYQHRAHMQQTGVTSAQVTGYETLLPALEAISSVHIDLYHVTTQDSSFILFCRLLEGELFGVLRSPHSNLEKQRLLNQEYMRKGLTVSHHRFIAGKLVET